LEITEKDTKMKLTIPAWIKVVASKVKQFFAWIAITILTIIGGFYVAKNVSPVVGTHVIMDFRPIRLSSISVVPGDSIVFIVKRIRAGQNDSSFVDFISIRDSATLEPKITPVRR